jgi:Flp pilus assembly protein TadB
MRKELHKKLLSTALTMFPDHLLGKREVFDKLYHGRSKEARILHHKENTAQAYLILFLLFLLLLLSIGISWFSTFDAESRHLLLQRPKLGDPPLRKTVEAVVVQGKTKVKRTLPMTLHGYGTSKVELQQYLDDLLNRLPSIIAGRNDELSSIEHPLVLPDTIDNAGASIVWISSEPRILDDKGEIHWLSIANPQTITLSAIASLGDETRERSYELTIQPPSKARIQESIERSLEKTLENVRKEVASGEDIHLPAKTTEGMSIDWTEKRGNDIGILVLVFALGFLLVFARRYEGAKKELLRERRRIERDLPEFVDALVLMLYAGSYTEAAIKRIATNYEIGSEVKGEYPLYEQIRSMRDHLEQSNVSLGQELRALAERCNIRELSRIITILTDNLDKGIALAEKLDTESTMLRYGRKRKSKEAGHIIETKLTFPMVLLLVSLLIITTGPVMIGL